MPVPIRYSDAPTQALLQQNRMVSRSSELLRRAELENQKVLSSIPMEFIRSMKSVDKDVSTVKVSRALDNLSKYQQTKNADANVARRMASQYAQDIYQTDAAIKKFRKDGEDFINRMKDGLGIQKDVARSLLGAHIIANVETPDKLGDAIQFISSSIEKDPALFVDRKVAINTLDKILKNYPTYEKIGGTTVNPTGMKTSQVAYRSKQKTFYEMIEEVDKTTGAKFEVPRIKLDQYGVVEDDVFKSFYEYKESDLDFTAKTAIDAGAVEMMFNENKGKKKGDAGYMDPENQYALNFYRKKYVTEYLKDIPVDKYQLTTSTRTSKARSSGGGGRRGGGSSSAGADYLDQVMAARDKSPDEFRSVLLRMKAGKGEVSVDDVVMNPDGKTFDVLYRKKDGTGGKTTLDKTSPNFQAEMAGFLQRAIGTDTKLEKKAMTTATKPSSTPAAKKTSGITWEK